MIGIKWLRAKVVEWHLPPAEPGRCPLALEGLFPDAVTGRCLFDIALEGLSCLDTEEAEPGLTISTVQAQPV